MGNNIQNELLFHSPHSASASRGCQGLEAAATAARCSDDMKLSHETVYFLEAAVGLRDVEDE